MEHFLRALLVVIGVVVEANAQQVCYAGLGCFSRGGDYPDALPQSPAEINTQFLLYTRANPATEQGIMYDDTGSVLNSYFDSSKKTKFLVHGYMDDRTEEWLILAREAILAREDVNVIVVDWGGGANSINYIQVAANTRLVGAQVARLITYLMQLTFLSESSVHLIGHSLGAHISGYAGERLQPRPARITALDAAEPGFQGMPTHARLDPSDAMFVDAIHTDGDSILTLGFGMSQPVGHLDFYPNGGTEQPGCEESILDFIISEGLIDGGKYFVTCNHKRAHKLFIDSISSACPWLGYPCSDWEEFRAGRCLSCSAAGCHRMGYDADKNTLSAGTQNVKLYLTTEGESPYCHRKEHWVTVSMSPGADFREVQEMYVTLHGTGGSSAPVMVVQDDKDFEPGEAYVFLVGTAADLGTVTSVDVLWEEDDDWYNPFTWFNNPTLLLDSITVDTAGSSTYSTTTFCTSANGLAEGQTISVTAGGCGGPITG
ncbi:PREDICTED: pancreatic triacylglycerol lipase-like isoform X2 [Branchiostoma belcheri]|uniref:Pancreatic triacylglycerol lipase-like isoform X2 n=1 Tax=Branchiostoma belcheri TaxID=7741 RepID=A0A6P5AJY6_BRABE|nr:PREDICTED: pancreatic triacylglycerol lipase-like isoform X2 [Branchiostoma belcheri]